MFVIFGILLAVCSQAVLAMLPEGHCYNSTSGSLSVCNDTSRDSSSPLELLLHETPQVERFLQLMPAFAPSTSKNEQCRSQSEDFLKSLADLRLWALQMYDATAKAGSGLMNGNTVLLGDIDQCLAVNSPNVKGKYCVTTIYVEPAYSPKPSRRRSVVHDVLDLMQSHNAMRNSYDDDMRFLPTFSPITWAVCVPSACTEEDVESSLTDVLKPFNLTSGVELRVRVQQGSCVTPASNPFDEAALYTAAVFAAILLLAVWGTFHERANTTPNGALTPAATDGTWRRVLLAFSFKKNMRALMDTSGPEDELSCVHGLRAIASLFIYIIHRAVFSMFYPYTNRTDVAELLEGDWTMIFRAFWNWVDSFVVLSGLLTSFYAVKKLQGGGKINIPRMYLQRYVKFTPMLFMMSLALQNLMQYMVSSPQRVRIVDHYIQNCKRGLLPVVTYTNTFEGFQNMCYPPSHQLATDMHMYLLSPFMILALWRWPKRGPIGLAVLLVALGALKYYDVYVYELGSFIYYGVSVQQMVETANTIYINAIHRLTPYIFGVGLGYLLRVKAGKCSLSRVQKAAGTAIALAGAFYSFYGVAHVARRGYQYDAAEAAGFAVVQPILWSFALCWLIFCCATGQAPDWLRNGLSWKGFVVFSRLSYAVYLIQIFVIAVNVGNSMTAEYFRITKLVDLNEITTIMVVSLLTTLLFLLPLQDLWNIAAGTYTVTCKVEKSDKPATPQVKPTFTKTDSWRD